MLSALREARQREMRLTSVAASSYERTRNQSRLYCMLDTHRMSVHILSLEHNEDGRVLSPSILPSYQEVVRSVREDCSNSAT